MESEETVSRLRDKVLAARIILGPTSDLKLNLIWVGFSNGAAAAVADAVAVVVRVAVNAVNAVNAVVAATFTTVAGVVAVVAAVHTAIVISVSDYTDIDVGVAAAVEVVAVVGGQEMILLRIKF